MKTLLSAVLIAFALNTQALTLQIFSMDYDRDHSFDEANYKVNPSMGRAWVEISIADDSDWEDTYYEEYRVKVPGMRFDPASGNIVVKVGSQDVVCATSEVRNRRVLRGTVRYIYPQSVCYFTTDVQRELVDDGYETSYQKRLNVYLNIQ